ncbi:MAG: hypothetical protein FWD97_01060 [Defluviitaleaceae bacterium]|nr:hypothetical protein [Defluviitaleaceae bacterium]
MSNQILIQYDEVYSKTAELRGRLETELFQLEETYRHLEVELQTFDGKASAAFGEAMKSNQLKAKVATETLQRLITFIELSSKKMQQEDQMLSTKYALADSTPRTEGGTTND